MIPIKNTHSIIRAVAMGTIWDIGSGPEIIDPIQGRLLCQDIPPRKNHQYFICVLTASASVTYGPAAIKSRRYRGRWWSVVTLERKLSAISRRVKAATASELSSVSLRMP